MTLQVWGGAAVLVAASVVIGRACALLGWRCSAAGPAVGMAALIVIAAIAIKLPGRAVTAAVVLLVLLLASGALVMRRSRTVRAPVVALLTLLVAGFEAAIPFLANGRVGLLGVSLDNDTANHLIWAEALRSPAAGTRYGLPTGYPLGPHSLVDALSSGLGVRLDLAFTALLVATVLITALTAAAALVGQAGWKRLVTGVLGALLYLPAAYYAEASFKETLLGVMLLGLVLHLEELRVDWEPHASGRWRGLLPIAVLIAGTIYTYSYVAIAWVGLTLLIWALAEVVAHPGGLRSWRRRLLELAPPAAIGALVLLILLLPSAGRIASFAGSIGVSPSGTGAIATTNLGNLPHFLSAYEALGIWNSPDFRFFPVSLFHAGELAALALVVLLLGFAWSVRRRELVLPAAVAACAIIYWRAFHGQSPYVAAKALVIAGPLVAVTGLRGLLCSEPRLPGWARSLRLAVAAGFVVFAAQSSYQALRDEPVWPAESTRELISLDQLTRGRTLLFLGASDYAPWIFHDSKMSALAPNTVSMGQALAMPGKPNVYATALDFDSVSPTTINRFAWIITTDTSYASQPPAGVRLVRQLPMYELWQRVAPVAPRQVIEPAGAPGAVLDCRARPGRELSHKHGVAAVMAPPVTAGLSGILPGNTDTTSLRLPAGTWDLSLQYSSPETLDVSAAGRRWRMPAYLDRPGPFFAVGTVVSTGAPVTVTVHAERSSSLTGPILAALLTQVVATPHPDPRVLVPLRRACGRYVDWLRLQP